MDDVIKAEDLERLMRIAAKRSMPAPHVIAMSKHAMWDLQLAQDKYGIYAERIALSKVLPGVKVFRGDEWWH